MSKKIIKYDTTIWTTIKYLLYLGNLAIFIGVLSKTNIGLSRLSRMLGITVVTYIVVGVLFLQVYGKYDIGRRKSKPIINSLLLASLCTDIITYLQVMIMRNNTEDILAFRLYSIGQLFTVFILQLILNYIFVYGGHMLYFSYHQPERCMIITSSQKSLNIMVRVLRKYKKQYHITHIMDYKDPKLKSLIRDVDTVFMYDVPNKNQYRIMRRCYQYKVNVYFNPELEDVMEYNSQKYVLDDVFFFNKNVKVLSIEERIIKRTMDIVLASLGGLITAPIWLVAMIAIKLEDGGPIIFKQKRATLNSKHFFVYKFRTMEVNAKVQSAKKNDKRITKVGAVLRRTRIDEIPQLLNVLKGEMAIVGPRPEMLENVKEYTKQIPEFEYRLRMKAGLTGYAQIEGKYNTLPKDKLIMDMMYMEQFSILKDIQLILQTVVVLLKMDSTEGFQKEITDKNYIFVPYEDIQD